MRDGRTSQTLAFQTADLFSNALDVSKMSFREQCAILGSPIAKCTRFHYSSRATAEEWSRLFRALEHQMDSLQEIKLNTSTFGDVQMLELAHIIVHSPHLHTLTLEDVVLSKNGMQVLRFAVGKSKNMRILSVRGDVDFSVIPSIIRTCAIYALRVDSCTPEIRSALMLPTRVSVFTFSPTPAGDARLTQTLRSRVHGRTLRSALPDDTISEILEFNDGTGEQSQPEH